MLSFSVVIDIKQLYLGFNIDVYTSSVYKYIPTISVTVIHHHFASGHSARIYSRQTLRQKYTEPQVSPHNILLPDELTVSSMTVSSPVKETYDYLHRQCVASLSDRKDDPFS